jgi:hypothetical protein
LRSIGGQPIIVYTAEMRRKLKIKLALVAKKLIKRGYKLLIYSVWGADHENMLTWTAGVPSIPLGYFLRFSIYALLLDLKNM